MAATSSLHECTGCTCKSGLCVKNEIFICVYGNEIFCLSE